MSIPRFLLLEDQPLDAAAIQTVLADGDIDFELLRVETRLDFETAIATSPVDLILATYKIPGFDGMAALEVAQSLRPETPFIFVSASVGEELAIAALEAGAAGFVLKHRLERLAPCIARALRVNSRYTSTEAALCKEDESSRAVVAQVSAGAPLHDAEALLQAVTANLPRGAAFVIDRDLRYLLAEGKALEAAGRTSEDLVGKTIWEALEPALANYYEPYFRQALSGELFSHEHYSHDRHYVSHGTPLVNEQGEVYAVLAMSYDITDRKRAEATLRQREAELARVQKIGRVAGIDIDLAAGMTTDLRSPEYVCLHGLSSGTDRETHADWLGRLHPNDRDHANHVLRKAIAGNSLIYENEYRIIRPIDGEVRWIYARSDIERDETGRALRLVGAHIDITDRKRGEDERKQAEDALRISEARYRMLFTSIDEAYAVVEPLKNDRGEWSDFRFIEVNPAFVEQTGMEYPVGRLATDLLDAPNPRWAQTWGQVAETGEPIRFEESEAELGRTFDLYAFRLADDRTVGVIFHDITERKQQEQRQAFLLKLSDALRSLSDAREIQRTAMRVLGEFLALDRAMYAEITPDGETVIVNDNYVSERFPALIGEFPLSAYGSIINKLRDGEPIMVADVDAETELTEAEKTNYKEIGAIAFVTIPLIKDGRWVSNLGVHQGEPRQWTTEEITLLQETAERTWAAVERARAEEAVAADLRDTQRLQELGARLVTEGNFEALYQEIISTAIALTHSDAGSVQILDNETQDLLLLATQGLDRTITDHFYRVDVSSNTPCGIALRTGERSFADFDVLASEDPNGSLRVLVEGGLLSAQSTPLVTRSGRVIGMISTHWRNHHRPTERELRFLDLLARQATDLIEQRQSEQALRQSESRFRLMVESAKEYAIVTLNLNGIVTSWNAGAERLLGYAEAEIVGRHARLIFTPEDNEQEKLEQAMQCAQAHGRAENERWYVRQDGRRFWGSGLVMPLQDEAGTIQGFVKILQDKTAERQNAADREQLLQQEQTARTEADRANRIKDEFLAVLSHELRSPLNPILGWAKLLQQGKLDAAKTKIALDTIERNAQLQAQLINDLLDISRILQGKLSLEQAAVDLSLVITSALETVRLAAEAKSLHIETTIAATAKTVIGDTGRLQQVIWNLLSNAVKFTPSGGQIAIALIQTDTYAQIQVADTGKGIRPDFLPYVFEHFRQEDGATTRKFGGLGLGLAIVRQIVELHGGTVAVDSRGEGQGATFTVQFPLAPLPKQQPSTNLPSASANDLSGICILVVDDEPDSRDFIAFVLEQAGAIVTPVSSGLEALQAIEQSPPDLIVSDIGMPDVDGYMLLQQIRGQALTKQVPAIALTAYAGEFDCQRAIAAGFQQHLAKPVDPDGLVRTIATLTRENGVSPSESHNPDFQKARP